MTPDRSALAEELEQCIQANMSGRIISMHRKTAEAILDALRAEQGSGEAVAWRIDYQHAGGTVKQLCHHDAIADYRALDPAAISIPLYTHAQPEQGNAVAAKVREIHEVLKRGPDTEDHGLMGNLRCILDASEAAAGEGK